MSYTHYMHPDFAMTQAIKAAGFAQADGLDNIAASLREATAARVSEVATKQLRARLDHLELVDLIENLCHSKIREVTKNFCDQMTYAVQRMRERITALEEEVRELKKPRDCRAESMGHSDLSVWSSSSTSECR